MFISVFQTDFLHRVETMATASFRALLFVFTGQSLQKDFD